MGVKPSALDEVFWSHSRTDLEILVSLKTQHELAKVYQQFETLRLVVAEALGGKPTSSDGGDDIGAVGSFNELAQAFQSMGGILG